MEQLKGFARVPLAAPTAGMLVEGVACLRSKVEKTATTGAPYLVVTLGHRDGQAHLKVWSSDMPKWAVLAEGDGVHVRLQGKAGSGSYGPEWTVVEITQLDPSHPIRDDALPACPIPLDELQRRWTGLTAQLTPTAQVLLQVILDHATEAAYWRAPAAEKMHHAVAPYGLAWHSIEVAELALALARAVPTYATTLSTDALILGGLLHDIGKIREYDVVPGVGIRRALLAGARYHTTLGIQMVAEAVSIGRARLLAASAPQWHIDFVCAVIESHHSIRDHGSPTPPASREAWLLHLGDMASAKLDDMTTALQTATALDGATWYRPCDSRAKVTQRFDLVEAERRALLATTDAPTEAAAPTAGGADAGDGDARTVALGDGRSNDALTAPKAAASHPTSLVTLTILPE